MVQLHTTGTHLTFVDKEGIPRLIQYWDRDNKYANYLVTLFNGKKIRTRCI